LKPSGSIIVVKRVSHGYSLGVISQVREILGGKNQISLTLDETCTNQRWKKRIVAILSCFQYNLLIIHILPSCVMLIATSYLHEPNFACLPTASTI
jgi:hypothetical protein